MNTGGEGFWSKVSLGKPSECWEWTGAVTTSGYGVTRSGVYGERRVHRVSWALTYGPIPGGLVVRHLCDNKRCCNPSHLSTGTQLDNIQDKVVRERQARGEGNGNSKLTESQVKGILSDSRPYNLIAHELKISPSLVSRIRRKKSWTYLSKELDV